MGFFFVIQGRRVELCWIFVGSEANNSPSSSSCREYIVETDSESCARSKAARATSRSVCLVASFLEMPLVGKKT